MFKLKKKEKVPIIIGTYFYYKHNPDQIYKVTGEIDNSIIVSWCEASGASHNADISIKQFKDCIIGKDYIIIDSVDKRVSDKYKVL
jgi:hypothetical protein